MTNATKQAKATTEQDGPGPSNAFVRVMQVHGKGEVCNEMADALRTAVEAVERTGKPSSVTLTMKVVPTAKGAHGIVFSSPKVKVAEAPRAVSVWYSDEEHNLHRNDPNQHELPLKTVAQEVPKEVPKAEVVNR